MHFSFTLHSRRAGKGVMGGRGAESGSRSSPSHAPIRHAGSSGIGDNDVTMLLHVTADHTSATVVSFPRDLVSIPLCGKSISSTMLNSTLSRGLSCTVQTIEKMTGLTIPYAGVITFDGVTGTSNAVGGVAVCLATAVEDPYTDPQLDLAAGQQTPVGSSALSHVKLSDTLTNPTTLVSIALARGQ